MAIAFIIKKCKARNCYRVKDLKAKEPPLAEGEEVDPEDSSHPLVLKMKCLRSPLMRKTTSETFFKTFYCAHTLFLHDYTRSLYYIVQKNAHLK